MPSGVDDGPLALGVTPPEHEYHALPFAVDHTYGPIGELLPPPALVRCGAGTLNRQHAIEQQHAAICPGREVSMVGYRDTQLVVQLLENILQ